MLQRYWKNVSGFHQLTEGLASQAFGFEAGASEYVVRVNESISTFQKDAFVGQRFAGLLLPVPEVLIVDRFDAGPAYCISRRAPGVRLYDLDAAGMARIVDPVIQVMDAIAAADLTGTIGFGRFDANGVALDKTWKEFLLAIGDVRRFDWQRAGGDADLSVVREACRRVQNLAECCPEERCLIHGDFGSYNVLAKDDSITAVLDWDLALFGDPLYEVANLFFWRESHLRVLIEHAEARWSGLSQWRERMLCYQLRIGLQEIYESMTGYGPCDVGWLTARCGEIITESDYHAKGRD